jgi:hypothetical protein
MSIQRTAIMIEPIFGPFGKNEQCTICTDLLNFAIQDSGVFAHSIGEGHMSHELCGRCLNAWNNSCHQRLHCYICRRPLTERRPRAPIPAPAPAAVSHALPPSDFYPQVYENRTGYQLIDATENNDQEIVQRLLEEARDAGQPFGPFFRGWAIREAARNSHLHIIRILQPYGRIPENDLSRARDLARQNHRMDIVEALLHL